MSNVLVGLGNPQALYGATHAGLGLKDRLDLDGLFHALKAIRTVTTGEGP